LEWYRTLIALRRRLPDITNPELAATEVTLSGDDCQLIMRRGQLTVMVNLGSVPLPLGLAPGDQVVASHPVVDTAAGSGQLSPDGVAIIDASPNSFGPDLRRSYLR
ncbi:MAG: DUF3459 domain-containing protein, partial [Actinomycetota bacterium]|nr:DUF3459 domain-containing protein [Actinomycetota bacterium]